VEVDHDVGGVDACSDADLAGGIGACRDDVGQVLIGAAPVAALWPFTIFVCLPALALLVGWAIYGDHGDSRDDGSDINHT